MKTFTSPVLVIVTCLMIWSCNNASEENKTTDNEVVDTTLAVELDTVQETMIADDLIAEDTLKDSWKTNSVYSHFKTVPLDTIRIGPDRPIKDPKAFFQEDRFNVYVIIDSGEYYFERSMKIGGRNIIIVGDGNVSLFCSTPYENVMWVSAKNVAIDNLHMMHKNPGEMYDQNCTGRVIAFDMADSITVMNCDLNGCGLAGLHDNLGNGVVFVEHNYIHNNAVGAYTDINGNVWQEEVDDHPVFRFNNNLIRDNGSDEIEEEF